MKLEIHMLTWSYFQQKGFYLLLQSGPSSIIILIKDIVVSIGNGWTRLLYPVLGDILLELLAKIFNLNWWGGC